MRLMNMLIFAVIFALSALGGSFELNIVNDSPGDVSIMAESNQCFTISIPSTYLLHTKTFVKAQIAANITAACKTTMSKWKFRVDQGSTYQDYEIFDDHQGTNRSQGIRYVDGFVEYVNSRKPILYVTVQSNQSRFIHIYAYNTDENGTEDEAPGEKGIGPEISVVSGFIPKADILGLVELDKSCSKSGNIDGVAEFASALHMNYISVSEFGIPDKNPLCMTENAILSRYPIKIIETYQFKNQCCLISGRTGGRSMVVGYIESQWLNHHRGLYVISTHLEAGLGNVLGLVSGIKIRLAQAREIVDYIERTIDPLKDDVVVLGDMNAPNLILPWIDFGGPVRELTAIGFDEALQVVNGQFTTVPDNSVSKLITRNGLSYQIDYILVRGPNALTSNSQVINNSSTRGLSDHVPVGATLVLEPNLSGFIGFQ